MDPENEYQEEYENDEEIQEENGEEEDGNGQEEFISGYERVKGKKRHRSSQEDFQENDHGQQEYFRGKSGEENHEYRYKIRRSGSDRSDIEQSYDHKSRRRSGTDFSDHEEERERRRRKKSEDREGKSRRRHHKHKKDRSKRSKSRLDDSRSSQELEPEDGEILEDGEIDEEEDDGEGDKDGTELEGEITHPDDLNMHPNQGARKKFDREVSEKSDGSYWNEEEYEEGYDEGRRSEGEEEINQQYKPDKRRHRRDKRERRGRRDDKRKKSKKGSKYHDYDNIDDDAQQGWMGPKKHSPGSRRTPPTDFNSPIYRGDKDDFGVMYNRGPPGPYDSPYESPPGPYDSPSDEDSQDEFGGKRDRNKKSKTMMNMLEDEMLDPNIAVDEGQMLYKRQGRKKKPGDRGGRDGHERGHKRKQQNKDYGDQYSEQPKKKPLLQTPMEERPICRFFKEGKCQKGNDCPFNHEGRLDKKPELCKYYLNSYCSKEDNCIFMHSEFPCKFFHTGQECYQGDDCKFSHDPLTEETRHLIEKKYNDHEEDRRHGNKPVRPSLLGSPPRHLMMDPATQERIKKIPSLFDIETFPPGHSPKKPMSQQQHGGMQNNHPPPHIQQQQQQRPTGFFNEINPNRMQGPGPGMHHPRGPMNQRPPRPPMEPSMGQRPMNPGPMGPRMNQGPMGPMNPPPRPMNQLNPALNPAVALVGALLQHAAGARPPLGGQPGGPGPNQGMMGQFHGGPDQQGNFGPDGPMENHRDPRQMQHNPDESQYPNGSHYDEQGHDTEDYEHWDENQNDPDMYGSRDELNDRSDVGKNDDPNKEKLAMIGLGTEMYSHLPSKHREMFLRMQGQQSIPEDMDLQKNGKINPEREKDIKKDRGEDKENKDKDVDDDNWYSSDEEENGGPKPKLTDILKNLSQQSSASTPQSPKSAGVQGTSTSSTLNIMQMINAIKTGGSTGAQAPSPSSPQILRDPRQRLDPRTGAPMKSNDPRTPPIIPVDSKLESVERNLPPPPPAIINSCEGDVQFRLVPVTKDSSSRTPPPGVNLHDPQYKNDPRIQKMLKHAETTNTNKSVPSDQKPADPRTQSERPSDPRVKVGSDGGKPADPRLQRGVSDSVGPRPQDPRLPRNQPNPPPIGVHNLPVKPTDPRLLNRQISQSSGSVGSTDPRLARQLSSSGNAPSRPADPRLMRQNSNQFHDMRQGPNKPKLSNIEQEPQRLDPRIKVGGPHRVMGDEQISVNNLNQQNDVQIPPLSVPTDSRQLGRQNSLDPRSKLKTEPFGSNLTDTRVPQISIEDGSENVQLTRQISNLDSEMEKTSAQSDQTDKPKLDYRNDPRFKRKPASKRKGSMEYASPLGDEGNQENVTGFNSYNRPQSNSTRPAKSSDSKNNKFDPRTNKHETNVSKSGNLVNIIEQIKEEPGSLTPPIPELPTFNPPPEPEINTKDFFKTMDPTASPFC